MYHKYACMMFLLTVSVVLGNEVSSAFYIN